METKILSEIMPKIPLDQVANYRPSDCLTDDEKRAAIEYAKRQVVDRMRFKMKQRGMRPGDIEFRISELTDETLSDMIDQEEVLRSANFRKFIFLQDLADKQAKDAERKKKIEDLAKECDANFFFNLLGGTFFVNMAFLSMIPQTPISLRQCVFSFRMIRVL